MSNECETPETPLAILRAKCPIGLVWPVDIQQTTAPSEVDVLSPGGGAAVNTVRPMALRETGVQPRGTVAPQRCIGPLPSDPCLWLGAVQRRTGDGCDSWCQLSRIYSEYCTDPWKPAECYAARLRRFQWVTRDNLFIVWSEVRLHLGSGRVRV